MENKGYDVLDWMERAPRPVEMTVEELDQEIVRLCGRLEELIGERERKTPLTGMKRELELSVGVGRVGLGLWIAEPGIRHLESTIPVRSE